MLFTIKQQEIGGTIFFYTWQLYLECIHCTCELYIWQDYENDALKEIDKYIYTFLESALLGMLIFELTVCLKR